MSASPNYLDPQVLARLAGLDLKARLIVEGFLSGRHRSPFQGFSVEFAEHREYVPGDDLRYVDWKVFGRRDRYYLKQYEEETSFACQLLLDTSESMTYRSPGAAMSKLDYARHVAAAITWLVLQQQDAVGLSLFDSELRMSIPPSGQPSQLGRVLSALETAETGGETELGPVLHEIAGRIPARGLVIVISDLFDDPESIFTGLKHFRFRRHDVSVLQVVDPAEQDFPFAEPTLFHGLEGTGDQMTDPRSLARSYRQHFEAFLQEVRGNCRDQAMQYQLLRTDQPLDLALSTFLSWRRRFAGRT